MTRLEDDLGPIDSREWPRELLAHAISPAPGPRLFGYDVERDLAAFYRFSDVIFLSLIGELPDEACSRAFEIALCFAAPLSVADAAIHAAVLSRLCGARPGGVFSTAGLTLAEHASNILEMANDVLASRESAASGPLPPELRAADDGERASVASLARLLDGVLDVPVLAEDPSRDVALVGVLRGCGFTSQFHLVSVLTLARLPSALAEASRTKPGDFATYPIDTPHFEYVAPTSEAGSSE
jgi:hypothetical protein